MRNSARLNVQRHSRKPLICRQIAALVAPVVAAIALSFPAAATAKTRMSAGVTSAQDPPVLLWRYPSDLESRNLFYGAGGKQHAPRGITFWFVEEVVSGTKPKYIVKDKQGVKWIIKLGSEARPETAATRFVWALGYFTDEDYLLPRVVVRGMPAKLGRGRKLVGANGSMQNVRLERMNKTKVDQWRWRNNPFESTRELNGLRVLMALLNNWDLKDSNNSIDEEPSFNRRRSARTYVVSDLGSTFGLTRATWPQAAPRGDPDKYRRSNFIVKVTADQVHLATPGNMLLFSIIPFPDLVRWRSIGRQVPRGDARWIGKLLGRLSSNQIRAAFRAAAYSSPDVESFSRVVESRIAELNKL